MDLSTVYAQVHVNDFTETYTNLSRGFEPTIVPTWEIFMYKKLYYV